MSTMELREALQGALEINWWTDMDILDLVTKLANEVGIDMFGQEDPYLWDRQKRINALRSLCTIIAEADIQEVQLTDLP